MHRNGIFHRDIKPENILILNENVIKMADFGSCRGIYSRQPFTEYISTRWYRAPECLLTDGWYDYKMDMWGIGCVFFEMLTLIPLFPGENELDQIHIIHNIIGSPAPEVLEKIKKHGVTHIDFNFPKKKGIGVVKKLTRSISADCLDLLEKMLKYNPDERITARQALRHPFFKDLRELEKKAAAANGMPKSVKLSSKTSKMPNLGASFMTSNSSNDTISLDIQKSLQPAILPKLGGGGATGANNNNGDNGGTKFPTLLTHQVSQSMYVDKKDNLIDSGSSGMDDEENNFSDDISSEGNSLNSPVLQVSPVSYKNKKNSVTNSNANNNSSNNMSTKPIEKKKSIPSGMVGNPPTNNINININNNVNISNNINNSAVGLSVASLALGNKNGDNNNGNHLANYVTNGFGGPGLLVGPAGSIPNMTINGPINSITPPPMGMMMPGFSGGFIKQMNGLLPNVHKKVGAGDQKRKKAKKVEMNVNNLLLG